jgi:hypothetical protein
LSGSVAVKMKDWTPKCPKCKGYMTYIHDLKCLICDNTTVVWCPKCQTHIRITDYAGDYT